MEELHKKEYPTAMHTAEHLLGGVMVRRFGCGRAVTTHLEKKKSKVDFDFHAIGRNLTENEVREITDTVNREIARNQDVTFGMVSREEAGREFDLSRLPEAAGGEGMLRMVQVGDYDRCLCIGEHVANTAEIGTFRIISTDYDTETGLLRIRFKLAKPE